jgi:hypothetical protein
MHQVGRVWQGRIYQTLQWRVDGGFSTAATFAHHVAAAVFVEPDGPSLML